jgi:hypothetical protein
VIHARLVPVHLPARDQVLQRLLAPLKPGGWRVVENFCPRSLPKPAKRGRSAELADLRTPGGQPAAILLRTYSAGRMWIVLLALLPRFWIGLGVGSVAWVPA